RLPDASVSGRHASLRPQGSGWVIVDEGSTNGTRVNGARLTPQAPRKIESGDVVHAGRARLTLRVGAAAASARTATRQLALALVARALGEGPGSPPTLRVVGGTAAGEERSLTPGARVNVGAGEDADVRTNDPELARGTLEIVLGEATVTVVARGEILARLGERALERDAKTTWSPRDLLRVGATTIALHDPVGAALEASAEGDDQFFDDVVLEPETAAPPAAAAVVAPVVVAPTPTPPRPQPEAPKRAQFDRRSSWRGATATIEIIALVVGLAVLAGSMAGLYWLLKK
ncbi:MAG: FHA domain-containing protein, partial [Polyangiales bacterium]